MTHRLQPFDVEPRWKTYSKPEFFLLAGGGLMGIRVFQMCPSSGEHLPEFGPDQKDAEGFWEFSMFLVHYGRHIFSALVVVFVGAGVIQSHVGHYRSSAVGGAVWLLNSVVICGLAALFTVTLIVFPSLIK